MKNKELVALLQEKNMTLSCSESMTGGMFAKYIIDVPGTSACFDRGLITYSNSSKIDELGVKKDTIDEYGAISKETALEMAEGLFKKTKSDICVSVTGNAGPWPSEEKEIGLYYVGLCISGKSKVFELRSKEKERNDIRKDACSKMFKLILKEFS